MSFEKSANESRRRSVARWTALLALFLLVGCGAEPVDERALGKGVERKKIVQTPSASSEEPKTPSAPDAQPLDPPKAHFPDVHRPLFSAPVGSVPAKKSSVLVVVVDAFNAKHTGVYGYVRGNTPNLNKLADDGVLFTNWVSNSSWTRPSFTSLITGLPKRDHKVELTGQNLDRGIDTVAELFSRAGYRTAGFVGNPLVRKIWAFDQGFQTYHDTKDHKAFPRGKILVDKAADWIRRGAKGDRPFFCMLFLTDAHTPYRPVDRHRTYLREIGAERNIEYPFKEYMEPLPKEEHDAIVAAYDGEVSYVDEQVGRLLEELSRLGLRESTTVVVTADHGEIFGEHNCYLHGYHMWEPVLRVPFIISSPALRERGVVNDRPHTHVDLLPTLAEVAGIAVPKEKPGVSIWKDTPAGEEERPRFSQYNAHGIRRQAVRKGKWKLIHHHLVNREDLKRLGDLSRKIPRANPEDLPSIAVDGERFELYDTAADPGEVSDLMNSAHKEIADDLKALIKDFDIPDPKGEAPTLSDETLEALKAAGYIQ